MHATHNNTPPRSRVEYKKDTKLMNAGTFIFQREDHTIGNILRMYERQ